jgi:hypothetical protein
MVQSAAEETAALIRGEGKKMLRKERKQKIEFLRSELGLADMQRTPKVYHILYHFGDPKICFNFLCNGFSSQPGESLKDFFSRTSMYWQMAAYEHTQHTGKVLFMLRLLHRCFNTLY